MNTTPRLKIRRVALAALAGAVVFALAGCLKLDMAMSIKDDKITGTMVLAVDKELAKSTGQDVEELFKEATKDSLKDLPDGFRQEKYDDGKYYGAKFTFENTPLKEFSGTGADDLTITHDGDKYKISGAMDMSGPEFGGGPTADPLTAGVLKSFDIKISFTFPGQVISHNGELKGTTVTWRPKVGEKNPIDAVANDSGGGGTNNGGGDTNNGGGGTNNGGSGGDTNQGGAGNGSGTDNQATKNAASESKLSPWLLWGGVGLVVVAVALALIIWMIRRKPASAAVSGYPGGYPQYPGAAGTPVAYDPYQQQGGYPPQQGYGQDPYQQPQQQGGYPQQQDPYQQGGGYPQQGYPQQGQPPQNPQQYPPQQYPPYGGQ